MKIPKFENKKDLFDYLVENKSMLIAEKKSASYKKADALAVSLTSSTTKAAPIDSTNVDKLQVTAIINTTGVMDSHKDVHIEGIWTKSLKEKKDILWLQEHEMTFDKLISDQVKATAETVTWKELGFNFKGTTQALTFKAEIEKSVNEFMFKRYANGTVKNHSVMMQYVKLDLAIDSELEEYKEEKRVWDKYIDQVVNQKDADSSGYFWAVTEAKVIEGSAVLKGSNSFTPTHSVEAKHIEPPAGTQQTEPPEGTPTGSKRKFY